MPARIPTEIHPKELGKEPPFEEKRQAPPGQEAEMGERPDHGEQTYQGLG